MAVAIRIDAITVYRPSQTPDEHGWAEYDVATEVGTYAGTLQEAVGLAGSVDPRAAEGGGSGPNDPPSSRRATAYLDTDVSVEPGDQLTAHNQMWLVTDVRLVNDPRGTGELSCLAAECITAPEGVNR